jgi:mRNA interferase MazF
VRRYVPRRGEFVTISLARRAGHEQRGRRPALVLSHDLFNEHTGLCIVCPVTTTRRDYPFHVAIPEGCRAQGYVMVEQVRSIDFRARQARRLGVAPQAVVDEALSLLDACLY